MRRNLLVMVRDGNVEKALGQLKKAFATTGLLKEIKKRAYYEQPSKKKRRKSVEARKRLHKTQKRVEVAVAWRRRGDGSDSEQ